MLKESCGSANAYSGSYWSVLPGRSVLIWYIMPPKSLKTYGLKKNDLFVAVGTGLHWATALCIDVDG